MYIQGMASQLVERALRHAPHPGSHTTAIAALQIVRADRPSPRIHSVLRSSLCYLAQGSKVVTLGTQTYRYGGDRHLFSSIDLPTTGEIVEASRKRPYLCIVVEIDPAVVFELVTAADRTAPRTVRAVRPALFVAEHDAELTDAVGRLLACLDRPTDARVLGPGVIREITYRLLAGRQGDVVRALGVADSQTLRIARVVERLKRDYALPLRTTELARLAGMSVSSLHEHFKKVTTLSPLQYQKQLRLQEARRLLLANPAGAADIGFTVGYESPSQFSREYARQFGAPPLADARRALAAPR